MSSHTIKPLPERQDIRENYFANLSAKSSTSTDVATCASNVATCAYDATTYASFLPFFLFGH
jgi:hypothetical protein